MAAVPSIGRASLVEAPRVAPQAAATHGLYERHAAKIQSYCQHQLGSREEAEDAVQTTFMNAFRALGRGVVPEAESAWLFKIAENVCLSRRRSSWRRGKIESPSDFGVIEEIVPGPNRQRDELIGIEDALASMPEQQRRAILLREWQGLSYREIATELEVSQSAVETLIFRARRSLAQGLEQPDSIKPAKRKSFRRALHALDLGTIVAAVKTLLAGSVAVKATTAAVVVTAAAGTAATVAPKVDAVAPVKTPAKALVAPAPEKSAAATLSFAPLASRTAEPAADRVVLAPPRPARKKPARTAVPRSTPAPVVPAAAAPVSAAPLAAEPEAPVAEPVHAAPTAHAEQPAAAPAPAPTPAAEQPKHEERKQAPPLQAEPAKRADEGKKDEAKTDEGKKDNGKKAETRRGKSTDPVPLPQEPHVVPAVVDVPSPKAVTAPVLPVELAESEAQDSAAQKDRRNRSDRRDDRGRASEARAPAVPPVVDPILTRVSHVAVPVPVHEPAAAPEASAPAADQRSSEGGKSKDDDKDRGNRGDRRRGK